MYTYAISYFEMVEGVRVPLSGLAVKLVSPGKDFVDGIELVENISGSGFYEAQVDDPGFYELWDDETSPSGAFSGKTCVVGPVNGDGIQNLAVGSEHLRAASVTESKVAANTISPTHLKSNFQMPVSKVAHEFTNQDSGVGNISGDVPEKDDTEAVHTLEADYTQVPILIIVPRCKAGIWLKSAVIEDTKCVITVAIENPDEVEPYYDIVAF